jgi:predicted Zn-dependent peptidase
MSGLIEETRRLREEPVDEEELSRAKAKLKGNLALRNQVSLSLAESMGMYELFGIGHTFTSRLPELVENVSADDILQAARLYFQPDRWTIAITRGQP